MDRQPIIATLSIALGFIVAAGVLIVTPLAAFSIDMPRHLPTVLFLLALGLLAFGCHRLDCLEAKSKHRSL